MTLNLICWIVKHAGKIATPENLVKLPVKLR